ncbi:putative sulfate exporter family transporter [Sphingomonas sp. 1P06PA]|uniref:YeiH family protein n=1 Tax=Sphingomonas sp. 1P06PA TaxID=554121 RepID=UPI0039A59A0A
MTPRPLPAAADLFGDLEPAPRVGWRDYLPGLAVSALAAMAAAFLADHYGAPLTLMALLVGLALNFLGGEPRLAPGLAFAARTLLRLGIVLVGLRLSFAQFADLGLPALLAIVAIAGLVLLAGIVIARALGFDPAFGAFVGGSVAICGASAALALATVLGERRIPASRLALVLVGVSGASSAAMFAYPIIARAIGLDDAQAGFMIGAAIHDVAQALGAGYAVSPQAGEVAAIVKLIRVALLAPVLAIVAACWPLPGAARANPLALPWFVAGFFAMAGLASLDLVPAPVATASSSATAALLAWAVAATAIRAPMRDLLAAGRRPLILILLVSLVALLLAATGAALLIRTA